MHRRTLLFVLLAAIVGLTLDLATPAARACPMCAESLPTTGSNNNEATLADNPSGGSPTPQLAEGFYYSILVMLVVPYGLLAGGGVVVYRMIRNAKLAKAAATAQPVTG